MHWIVLKDKLFSALYIIFVIFLFLQFSQCMNMNINHTLTEHTDVLCTYTGSGAKYFSVSFKSIWMVQQFESCVCTVSVLRTGYWHICICKSYKICLCRLVISNRNTQKTYFFNNLYAILDCFVLSTKAHRQSTYTYSVFAICCCTSCRKYILSFIVDFIQFSIFYEISSPFFSSDFLFVVRLCWLVLVSIIIMLVRLPIFNVHLHWR